MWGVLSILVSPAVRDLISFFMLHSSWFCVCVFIYMLHIRGSQGSNLGFLIFSIFYFETTSLSLALELETLAQLAGPWAPVILLSLNPRAEVIDMYHHIQLVRGGWDLNSGIHACKAGIFLTEPSQQPLAYFVSFFKLNIYLVLDVFCVLGTLKEV